ncbi:unnamed protein product [Parnassius mnemosyne]|uniref:FLYWCH-type domain-containing protein n=1 Tax=Parnassius mnemosyne TaxID=213953 RepID=A0AAV1KB71_9NEOP
MGLRLLSKMQSFHSPSRRYSCELITFNTGKQALLYNGYLYYRHYKARTMVRWSCTTTKCRAYLYVSEDLKIQRVFHEHFHGPRKLHKTSNGLYFKI